MSGSSRNGLFPLGFNWQLAVACGVILTLAACSTLPGRGPTKSEIIGQEKEAGSVFTIVQLTPENLEILKSRKLPTLRGIFGDYRPSPGQTIGVGDKISVTIWEAAAGGLFSAPAVDRFGPGSRSATIPPQVVGRDRSITVPYAGRVRVAGLRTKDVESTIVARLKNKAIDPQALVTVIENASNTVTLVGEQTRGAVIPLNVRGQRLLDVLAVAGGVNGPIHESFVILARGKRVVKVPVQTVLTRPRENIYLRPRDVVTVVRSPPTFTTVGATGFNAVIPFGSVSITLEEALARSGGLVDAQSDPRGVFILRFEPYSLARRMLGRDDPRWDGKGMVPIVYNVNLKQVNSIFLARHFQMQDKDIVYVANAPATEVQKAFTVVNNITNTASAITNTGYQIRAVQTLGQ